MRHLALIFWIALSTSAPTSAHAQAVAPSQAATLEHLAPDSPPVSLDLSLSQLNASPKAKAKLQLWVRAGGVVMLHTDAAQLFGFQTVAPRKRTRDVAGQQFGRGEAALPYGASPLLWNAASESLDGQSLGLLGVQTVFYQLRAPDPKTDFAGDCLLSDVGNGWPLLRVCDVAPQQKPQFAAALRSFGRGFALFLPGVIENRSDGKQFTGNIRDFLAQVAQKKWTTLPLAPLSRAFDDATAKRDVDFAPLVKAVGNAIEDDAPATQDTATEDAAPAPVETKGTPLLVRVEELQTLSEMWGDADKSDDDMAQARSLLLELAARYTLSQTQDGEPVDDGQNAALARLFAPDASGRTELAQVEQDSPHARTTRWWCGVFALTQTLAPSSTQPAGAPWPEPVLFSFARPALEAASWWQNASTEELSRVEVGKCAQAVTKMAQGHKDDPPLLMAWQTQSGARWKLLLSPMEAVSNRFPALVKDWGVPILNTGITPFDDFQFEVLRPIGSANAMDPRSPDATIAYALSTAMRWQMLRLISESLPGWSRAPQTIWTVFRVQPYPLFETGTLNGRPITRAVLHWDNEYQAYAQGNLLVLPGYYSDPLPTQNALLAMRKQGDNNDQQIEERTQIERYVDLARGRYWVDFQSQLKTFPPRFARIESALQVRHLTEQASGGASGQQNQATSVRGVPGWMEQGLENLSSLEAGDLMSDVTRRDGWFTVPASAISRIKGFNQALEWGISSARTRSIVAAPVDKAASLRDLPEDAKDDEAYTGPDLEDEDATKQMRFFLDRFGSGALTEIIQRIGAGQSPDDAMQQTIEMNQNEFFDAWRDNENTTKN